MNTHIETPARATVTALALNDWKGVHTQQEWRAVGVWWAKVLLLLGHEKTTLENPRLQKAIRYQFEPPMPDLRWLTDGTGVPLGLSVFVHNCDLSIQDAGDRLAIPSHVNFDDGTSAHCHVLTLATRGLCVTVVSHPGVNVVHPMVQKHQAWELLHSSPKGADLSLLDALGRNHVRYVKGAGVPEGHQADSSEHKFFTGLFGYESDQTESDSFVTGLKGRFSALIGRWRAR